MPPPSPAVPRVAARLLAVSVLLSGGVAPTPQAPPRTAPPLVRSFDEEVPGTVPHGFTFAEGRGAPRGGWRVQRIDARQVLAYLGDPSRAGGFVVALADGPQYLDVAVGTRLKLAGGTRSAGVVWRYHDPDNYYLLWLDLSAQRVGIYRFTRGHRIRLRSEADLELDPDAWHTLKAVHEGSRIKAYVGGIRVFETRDRTIPDEGGVGLWSAADSLVYFDDLRIEPLAEDHESARRRGRK